MKIQHPNLNFRFYGAIAFVALCLFSIPKRGFTQDSIPVFKADTVVVNTPVPTAPGYTINQPAEIAGLMEKYKEYNTKREFTEGYRVQINYTDIREEVYQSKAALYKEFPELTSYVEYEQPYYKLRVGDFKTRLEATHYLQQITAIYSGAFIVRDKIKIR